MEGKVKWFSVDKGYGFITGTDGTDRYFSVRDVVGSALPGNGDLVTFEHQQGKKGARAAGVKISRKAEPPADQRQDSRVTCSHCNRNMVPRIVFSRSVMGDSVPSYSLCPFCGKKHKDFGNCFIASAVYGDTDMPQVVALRHYRDNHLMQHFIGRTFVAMYYKVSPPIAKVIRRYSSLRRPLRRCLDAIVRRLENV